MENQKHIYVVLGMARSGTSVMARALKSLGIDLGHRLVPPSDRWNPTGFFEDNEIVYGVNTRLTNLLDCADGIVFAGQQQQTSSLTHEVRQNALELLKERFTSTQYWGFKDPRTVKVLTFWQNIFSEMQLNEHYLIAVRNPVNSAQSYMKLGRCDFEMALLLWFMHSLYAIEDTHGKNRMVVSYELLMQQPHEQLQRMHKQLNISMPINQAEINLFIDEFMDKNLRHYTFDDKELGLHPSVSVAPLCRRLYGLMMQLARDEISFSSEEFTEAWRDLKHDFTVIYPIYNYVDVLLKRNKQLDRSLRTIKKSVLWKMLAPLRFIDDALRAQRKKSKLKRRLARSYG